MNFHHIPWQLLITEAFRVLAAFGLIPGTVAAVGVRRSYQKRRQKKAIEGWPATDAKVLYARVESEKYRTYWVEVTYSYYVGEYRSGTYVRRFPREEQADDFIHQVKDQRLQVHYDRAKPDTSVILDRDIEMIAMIAPQYR